MAEARRPRRGLAFGLLLGVVMVWGCTFALVKGAIADASPLLFNLVRFTLAAAVLVAVGWKRLRGVSGASLRGGVVAGSLLAAGYELQTAGLARTTAVHSAFITGLVVVFVPLLSLVPQLRSPGQARPRGRSLAGAAAAFVGLFLITTPGGVTMGSLAGSVGVGDLLTLGCALAFAGHLLSLSRLAALPAAELVPLQIVACAVVMLVCLPMGGPATLHATPRLAVALAITSLLATAGAFWVQTWAQQHLPATTTAMILTMEPVFALAFAMLFFGERLGLRSSAGAGLILTGIAVTELLSPTTPASFEAS